MIDTITIEFRPHRKIGKKLADTFGINRLGKTPTIIDPKTGLKLIWFGGIVRAAEVSLSRFAFKAESNLRPLIDQAVVNKAVQDILAEVDQWTAPRWTGKWWFSRVDLAWNFHSQDTTAFILAHQFATHRKAQRHVNLYRQKRLVTGIEWQGCKLKITIYDKKAERLYRTPNAGNGRLLLRFPRVEIQLRGNRLKHLFGKKNPVEKLGLEECYRVYRELLLEFAEQVDSIPKITGKDSALFLAQSKGVDVFNQLLPTFSGATRKTFLAEYEKWKRSNELFYVDWPALLPETFSRFVAASKAAQRSRH